MVETLFTEPAPPVYSTPICAVSKVAEVHAVVEAPGKS